MSTLIQTIIDGAGELVLSLANLRGARRRQRREPTPTEMPGSNATDEEVEAARAREQKRWQEGDSASD
jgi:hypothetical protein